MNSNFGNNQINSLIMISNARGSHLFAKYGRDESPIFKIKAVQTEFAKPKLRLTVMEVIYPRDLYRELDSRAAVLMAIKDGMAVVKETDTMITFIPEMGQRSIVVEIPEVDCECCKLIVESPVYVKGDCSQPIRGRVDVDGNCPARNLFYVCQKPRHGILDLDCETGEWVYQSRCEDPERDTFEIIVWNVSGGWATQRTMIACESQPEVIDVNILNTPLTIVAEYPIDVNVATLPPVVVRTEGEALAVDVVGMASVTIDGAVEVTGLNVEFPDVMTVTTAGDDALTVNVIGVPSVTIDGPVQVSGIEISGLELTFPDVMMVTTAGDGPLAVSVTGVPTVTLDGAVEVTGVDIKFPDVMMVTTAGDGPLAVSVTGVPTVTLDGAVEVTGVDIKFPDVMMVTTAGDGPLAVSVTGVPTVTLDGAVEVTGVDIKFPDVMMVTTAGDGPLAVSVTGVPTVTLDGAVEVTGVDIKFPEIMTVTTVKDESLAVSVTGTPSVTIDGPVTLTPYGIYTASTELGDIAGGADAQALFDTSKSIDQTIFVKIRPEGVTASIQPIVIPAGDTETYALGDPIQKASNFAFINTTPASKVGVKVTNLGTGGAATPLSNPVVTIESHEPVETE